MTIYYIQQFLGIEHVVANWVVSQNKGSVAIAPICFTSSLTQDKGDVTGSAATTTAYGDGMVRFFG